MTCRKTGKHRTHGKTKNTSTEHSKAQNGHQGGIQRVKAGP